MVARAVEHLLRAPGELGDLNTQEWPDYYDQANVEDLRKFFDRYLKDEDNDWEQTPRVRYSVLDLEGNDRIALAAAEFPPADVTSTKYYLDGRSRTLRPEASADDVPVGYAVGANPDAVSFLTRFEQETVLVGYPKAHLWVEANGADDMDLFVLIQKLDAQGTPLQAFTVPNHTGMAHDVTERGGTILRYKGSDVTPTLAVVRFKFELPALLQVCSNTTTHRCVSLT